MIDRADQRVPIMHETEVGSTNDRVLELVRERNTPAPLAVRADVQTTGRGRLGRTWASPTGGLWLSLAWPLPAWPQQADDPSAYACAPILAGLAVYDTVLASLSAPADLGVASRLRIKWPNDLLLDGAKLAGVLCERPGAFAAAGHPWLVVGVGINLDTPSVPNPAHGIEPIGWRNAFATPVDAASLADHLVTNLAGRLHELEADPAAAIARARREAERALAYKDQPVRLSVPGRPDRSIQGVALGLDDRLRLRLQTDDRREHACDAGEVERLRPIAQPATPVSRIPCSPSPVSEPASEPVSEPVSEQGAVR